jgi:hypothetical protein
VDEASFVPILNSNVDHPAARRNLLAISAGTVIGLFFGLPPAFGTHAMGLPWFPYGVATMIIGLVIGLSMAFTAEAVFLPHEKPDAEPAESPQASPVPERTNKSRWQRETSIRRRLAEEKERLERLDAERRVRDFSGAGKNRQERIVWSELLELELQDVDEQVSRIYSAADRDEPLLGNQD